MAYSVDKLSTIDLGRQGENLARTVEIDVSSLLDQWPDAIISLLCKRKHDTVPYVAVTEVKDGMLIWPITSVETEAAGDGKIELRAVCGDIIAKSMTAVIRVTASLTGTETDVPDAAQGWVDQVLAAGSGVEANAIRAEEAAVYAEEAVASIDTSVEQAQEASRLAGQEAAAAEGSAEEARQIAAELSAEIERIEQAVAGVEEAENKLDSMTVSAETLEAGVLATATVTDDGTAKRIAFGIPKGDPGEKPVRGEDYWTEADKQEIVTEAVSETMEQVRSISFYICSADEVDENGVPIIASPDDSTFYLVSSGEEQPNLFIEWVYLNGQWERFGSATVDMSGYVKNTDYASSGKHGIVTSSANDGIGISYNGWMYLVQATQAQILAKEAERNPITPAVLDHAVKVGLTTNTLSLTEDEQAAARTWLNAIGKTDYATADVAGVVKVGAFGIDKNVNGVLYIDHATNASIDAKNNQYAPISTKNLDYAVKKALADSKLADTNNAWTDDEKAGARELLGALGKEDYATATTPGVAKIGSGLRMSSGGALTLSAATDDQIIGKKAVAPITPTNIDRAVKVGLTTNTISLTEEEQSAAQAWLGGKMVRTIEADDEGNCVISVYELADGIYALPPNTVVNYTPSKSIEMGNGTSFLQIRSWDTSDINPDYAYLKGTGWRIWYGTADPYITREYFGVVSFKANGTLAYERIINIDYANIVFAHKAHTWSAQQTFSAQPTMTATLAADDNSTNIPTTQWVNAAIQNALTALDATEVVY